MSATRTIAVAVTIGAAALSFAGPATAAPVASPAPAVAVQAAVNPSNIDPNATTTLDIHKYLGAPTGQPNNGTQQSVSLPPLQGVPFDVYQVVDSYGKPVDLTTNAGWAAATDLQGVTLSAANVAGGTIKGASGTSYTIKLVSTVLTDATGDAKYTQTGPGLFFVNENLSKATTVTNTATNTTVDPATITPAAPFLVTLPMTNPDGNQWMYTVNVYPKNSSDSITKTVKDQQEITTAMGSPAVTTNADSLITYGLTGTITPGMTGTQMGAYALVDQLPKGETFENVANVKVSGSAGADLVAGTDYQVWVNGVLATGPSNIDGPMVQITMTQSGLDKIAQAKAADPSAVVSADLTVKSSLPAGDLLNTANLIPSNSWWQSFTGNPTATYNPDITQGGDTPTSDNGTPVTGTPITSNKVDTKIGSALLTKVDAQDATVKLAGAKFDLYSGMVGGDMANPKPADCSNLVTDPAKMVMTGLTTASDGTLTINGLQQSDFYNNVQQPANGGQYIVYCLVETQAPSGYNLNAEPTAFYVTGADNNAPIPVTVQDEKTNLANALPLTGGAGAGILSIGGLALVGGTLAARGIARKRRANDEENELD